MMEPNWIFLQGIPSPADQTLSPLETTIGHSGPLCPYFLPRVTLLQWKTSDPLESIVEKLKTFSSSLPFRSIPLTLGALKIAPHHLKSHSYLFFDIPADSNTPLWSFHQRVSEFWEIIKNTTPPPFSPHASVFFGEEGKCLEVFDRIGKMTPGSLPLEVQIGSILLSFVPGGSNVSDLRYVGQSPMGTTQFFRTSLYIDGTWCSTQTWNTIKVINPATKIEFHRVPAATASDIDKAVAAAKRAYPEWRCVPRRVRAQYLRNIAEVIEIRREQLVEMEVLDNGKPRREAVEDINDAAACFRYYADLVVKMEQEELSEVSGVHEQFSCRVRRSPVGVCALIIPWNYPTLMLAWKVAPCLASGCTAVLKPSELTPLSALEFGGICDQVGLPRGVLNICTGYGPEAGGALTAHPDIHKVAFTGSVGTGTQVMTSAAASLKRCSLELGGKSPILVFPDAEISAAVDWISMGIFFNAGQVCSATSRLIVHVDVKEKVLSGLVELANKIVVGSGLDPETKLGPVVNESQYQKVLQYIQSGISSGAKLLCGGLPNPEDPIFNRGYFIPPTIFDGVTTDMKIWKEEIFGPVLSVMSFSDPAEAIMLANSTEYGLAAAVMSQNRATCEFVASQLDVGIVWVNCSQPTFIQLPWGGTKKSGIGRELGPWGLENYLEVKQVTSWADPKAKGWGWFVKE